MSIPVKVWLASGTGARVGALVMGGAAVAGTALWLGLAGKDAPEPAAKAAEPVLSAAPVEDVAAAVEEGAEIAPPVITTWLVTPAGDATIGGLGEADAMILVLRDGDEIASTRATRAGEFALVTGFAPNPQPSVLSLVMVLEDGRRIASKEVVAIGPVAGAGAVAEAGTDMPGEIPVAAPLSVPPVALMVSEAGAVVLQPAAPDEDAGAGAASPVPVTVTTITYNTPDLVQIGGSGAPGGYLRLYLDNQPVGPAEVQITATGTWQAELSGIAAGLYTLRVDQLDGEGSVTARYETPFRRETPEALAALAATPVVPPLAATALEPAAGSPQEIARDIAGEILAATPAQPRQSTPDSAEMATEVPPAESPPAESPSAEIPPAEDTGNATASLGTPGVAQDQAVEASSAAPPPPVSITVQPGHTLWAIAREEFGEGVLYVQLFEANRDRIRDPDLIYPGQVFTLPGR